MSKEHPAAKLLPKICPECSEDLTGRDVHAHIRTHYGAVEPDPRLFKEASKRYKILVKMARGGA